MTTTRSSFVQEVLLNSKTPRSLPRGAEAGKRAHWGPGAPVRIHLEVQTETKAVGSEQLQPKVCCLSLTGKPAATQAKWAFLLTWFPKISPNEFGRDFLPSKTEMESGADPRVAEGLQSTYRSLDEGTRPRDAVTSSRSQQKKQWWNLPKSGTLTEPRARHTYRFHQLPKSVFNLQDF